MEGSSTAPASIIMQISLATSTSQQSIYSRCLTHTNTDLHKLSASVINNYTSSPRTSPFSAPIECALFPLWTSSIWHAIERGSTGQPVEGAGEGAAELELELVMDSRQMQHENAGNNRLSVLRRCELVEPVRDRERTYINNV